MAAATTNTTASQTNRKAVLQELISVVPYHMANKPQVKEEQHQPI